MGLLYDHAGQGTPREFEPWLYSITFLKTETLYSQDVLPSECRSCDENIGCGQHLHAIGAK
jgi:hypothetical protein